MAYCELVEHVCLYSAEISLEFLHKRQNTDVPHTHRHQSPTTCEQSRSVRISLATTVAKTQDAPILKVLVDVGSK